MGVRKQRLRKVGSWPGQGTGEPEQQGRPRKGEGASPVLAAAQRGPLGDGDSRVLCWTGLRA